MSFKRATMDFFGAQVIRKRATVALLVQFMIAIAISATASYFVVMIYIKLVMLLGNYWRNSFGLPSIPWHWWDQKTFIVTGSSMAILILGSSLFKIFQLTRPVGYVMNLVGASEVTADTLHPPTKRFINVVEEMAIASAIPIPTTYVMVKEPGINALAVGWSQDHAAIAVTNGAINMLTRDELQGVIAHEFSHILNGDMALNVRLLGVLHGIDRIGFLGQQMFRALLWSSRLGVSGMDNGMAVLAWVGLFMTLPLLFVSSVGVVLGNAIRGAISRQREYLADASSVQFTRNPAGITGALKKIGGLLSGSSIGSPSAMYASHFFFSSSARTSLMSQLSDRSHPPLLKRIRKVDPTFDGVFPYVPGYYNAADGPLENLDWLPKSASAGRRKSPGSEAALINPDDIIDSIGAPEHMHLYYISQLLATIPASVIQAVHTSQGAEAFVYALLISRDQETAAHQLKYLADNTDNAVYTMIPGLVESLTSGEPASRLTLLDMAIPSLKRMTKTRYGKFAENLASMIMADQKEDLSEFVLRKVITRHLEPCFTSSELTMAEIDNVRQIKSDCVLLLTHVAAWETLHAPGNTAAFSRGLEKIEGSTPGKGNTATPGTPPVNETGFAALDAALERISSAKLHVKKQVLIGCISCITADGKITVNEVELLRAIADALKLNLPPIMTGPVRDKYAETIKRKSL